MTEMPYTPTDVERDALSRIRTCLGPKGWVDDAKTLTPWLIDSRRVYEGRCLGMARPANTQEVAEILAIAYKAGLQIVPQGGNTGRVGGRHPIRRGGNYCLIWGA